LSAIFRKQKLEITIEANKEKVEFLDIYLDLDLDEYGPFRKPGDTPVYVHSQSNHPRKVLENIPFGVNKRLSRISSSKEIFDKAAEMRINLSTTQMRVNVTVLYLKENAHEKSFILTHPIPEM
jgi:hypothetical protein